MTGQIASKLTTNSQCTQWVSDPLPPVSLFPSPQCPSPLTFNPSSTALATTTMIISTPHIRSPPKIVLVPRSLDSSVPSLSLSSPTIPPPNLLDRDGVLVEAAPHWSWESARVTAVPRARYAEHPGDAYIPSLEDVGGVICDSV